MNTFKITKMTSADVNDVFHLEELIHPNHHWSKDSFYSEASNNLASYFCIRNEQNILAGYIGIWKIIDEAHITSLAVHPGFRQSGAASALMVQIILC